MLLLSPDILEFYSLGTVWNLISVIPFQGDGGKIMENAHFMQIYRSREVGQSYITSIVTKLLATSHGMWLVIRIRPQVVCTLFQIV
jgi:hypothetical protein